MCENFFIWSLKMRKAGALLSESGLKVAESG
jgi:hypothetical protein